jgi:hypothetical protein
MPRAQVPGGAAPRLSPPRRDSAPKGVDASPEAFMRTGKDVVYVKGAPPHHDRAVAASVSAAAGRAAAMARARYDNGALESIREALHAQRRKKHT